MVYRLLFVLMILNAASEFRLPVRDLSGCHSRQCVMRVDSAIRRVLKIDWQPIVMFPKEANRFR